MPSDNDGPPLLRRDHNLFRIAKLTAKHSTADNFKMGAVIAKGNKVLGLGFNDPFKTHPKSNTRYQYIHAELSAILNTAREDLKGSSIYVYRLGCKEAPLLAKPCPHCMELIKRSGIKHIFYSTYGGYAKLN